MPFPSDPPEPTPAPAWRLGGGLENRAWIGLLLVIVFVVLVRIRWLDMPLERDEGEFAYGGQLMLDGVPPFKLLYNIKQPGIYAAYALIMAVFGQSPWGIHLGLMAANVAAIVLIFLLGRRFFDPVGAVAAAASYGLMSLSWSYLGFAAHATHFVALAGLGGMLLLLKALDSGRRLTLFSSGFLFGLAFELKQPGLMYGIFGGVYLLYVEWKRKRAARPVLAQAAVFSAGCVAPYLLTCLILWRAGVFATFWKWTWHYATGHTLSLSQGWAMFKRCVTVHMFLPDLLFWVLGLVGLGMVLARRELARERKIFLTGLLASSLAAVSLGLYFYSHYFVMLLPALALINGAVFDAMRRSRHVFPAVMAWLLLACGVYETDAEFRYLFQTPTTEITWTTYPQAPFTAAMVAAQFIQTNSAPSATMAVMESEPEIYFYAHRRSVTGYIYAYDFMLQKTYAREMQEEVIREVESARPEWMVYVSSPGAWLAQPDSSKLVLDWCQQYIPAHYDLVGVVDQPQSNEVLYAWGEEAGVRSSRLGPAGLRIFKRKTKAE